VFRKVRPLCVACVTACLVMVPWTNALAREGPDPALDAAAAPGLLASLRHVTFETAAAAPFAPPVPSRFALQQRGRQSVATTTESKLLIGIIAGSMMVGGMALMAYGSTSTCKGSEVTSTSACDKKAVIGALSFSGGATLLALWALSR